MLPTFFLMNALTMPQSYEYIIKLCKNHPNYCKNNKQKLCKKILKLSNYTVFPEGTNFCKVYKELAELARNVEWPHKSSYISMKLSDGSVNLSLLELVNYNSSLQLISFLRSNGYNSVQYQATRALPVGQSNAQATRILPLVFGPSVNNNQTRLLSRN